MNAQERTAMQAALDALDRAEQFIRNGIALGYIRMPDADTPDTAHQTPEIVRSAANTVRTALAQPEPDSCPTCGSYCNERDELDKAEREIERLRSINSDLCRKANALTIQSARDAEEIERLKCRDPWDLPYNPKAHTEPTALAGYKAVCREDGCEPPSALERLRFFCSLAMKPQDWLDVEPFFEALAQPETDNWNEVAALNGALENCRLFASRHRNVEWAQTILRFCAEVGVRGSPLRAQPEPAAEPVAWQAEGGGSSFITDAAKRQNPATFGHFYTIPLYAAPQRRKPLTEEQCRDMVKDAGLDWQRGYLLDDPANRYDDLIRAVERKHEIGDDK